MVLIVTPSGRLKLQITWNFQEKFTCINDAVGVRVLFFESMWNHAFHLAYFWHPINLSEVMIQKANPGDEVLGH